MNLCFSVPGDGKQIDILNHINLTVPDGKLVVITGPNGSGKSTLARVIMGLEKAICRHHHLQRSAGAAIWGSPSGPSWASATASSSLPGSRA